jgi:hypothetical protein
MVKNINGGNKSKKFARKGAVSEVSSRKLRLSESSYELYACVTRVCGQGRFKVITASDHELTCIMRRKFSGKNKRFNIVGVGSILLVGLREFVADAEDLSRHKDCDLLEIYDSEEYLRLKSIPNTGVGKFDKIVSDNCGKVVEDDVIEFTADETNWVGKADDVMPQKLPDMKMSGDDEFDIDDI